MLPDFLLDRTLDPKLPDAIGQKALVPLGVSAYKQCLRTRNLPLLAHSRAGGAKSPHIRPKGRGGDLWTKFPSCTCAYAIRVHTHPGPPTLHTHVCHGACACTCLPACLPLCLPACLQAGHAFSHFEQEKRGQPERARVTVTGDPWSGRLPKAGPSRGDPVLSGIENGT